MSYKLGAQVLGKTGLDLFDDLSTQLFGAESKITVTDMPRQQMLNTTPHGPLSPAQLADLDRALTPEEYAAVSDYQSKQADAQYATEHAKQSGPYKVSVDTESGSPMKPLVTTSPFSLRAPRVSTASFVPITSGGSRPWWHYALAVAGAGAVGFVAYKIVRS